MLKANNPEIDVSRVEEVVRHAALHRRRDLVASDRSPATATGGIPPLNWRQRLRSLPVAGPILARLYHRYRAMSAPGASLRERLRATPLLGDGLAWLRAIGGITTWRRQLQNDLTHTRQQVAALRQAQAELRRELDALRAQRGDDAR